MREDIERALREDEGQLDQCVGANYLSGQRDSTSPPVRPGLDSRSHRFVGWQFKNDPPLLGARTEGLHGVFESLTRARSLFARYPGRVVKFGRTPDAVDRGKRGRRNDDQFIVSDLRNCESGIRDSPFDQSEVDFAGDRKLGDLMRVSNR